jgi:hypothetical protein
LRIEDWRLRIARSARAKEDSLGKEASATRRSGFQAVKNSPPILGGVEARRASGVVSLACRAGMGAVPVHHVGPGRLEIVGRI